MKRYTLLGVLLVAALASACSTIQIQLSGKQGNETREVQGFTGIELATLGDVTITFGEAEGLRIEADTNVLPYLETVAQNGTLVIRSRPVAAVLNTDRIRYFVTAKQIDSLEIDSLGSIQAPEVQANTFRITVNSLGSVHIASLKANDLKVTMNSTGNVEIGGGQVSHQEVSMTSVGSYRAGDMVSSSASVNISSVGSATIWVTESLSANVTSLGSLSYYGSPRIQENVTSLGKVRSLGNK